jgi:hypothetical protein
MTVLPASVTQLAAQHNLGAFSRVHIPKQPWQAWATGGGIIIAVTLLFIVGRFLLQTPGGSLFVALVSGVAVGIVTIRRGYTQRGRPVFVFENGIVVSSPARRLVALRWEDLYPPRTHLRETGLSLSTTKGAYYVSSALVDFETLKATIAAHLRS